MPVYWILPLPARSCKWNIDLLWRQEQQTSLFPDPFSNNMLLWGRVTLLLIALAMVWIHLPTTMFNSMLCKMFILLNVMPRAFCPRFSQPSRRPHHLVSIFSRSAMRIASQGNMIDTPLQLGASLWSNQPRISKMKKTGLLKRLAPYLRRAFTRIDLMGENGLGAFQ